MNVATLQYHKLQVSRKSWHYRFLKRFLGRDPRAKSLCAYFWSTVWAAVCIVFIVLAGTLAIGAILFLISYTAIEYTSIFLVVVITIGTIFGLVVAAITLAKLYAQHRANRPARMPSPPKPPKPPKQPSMLRQYLKAKKTRVCPLIDYTD